LTGTLRESNIRQPILMSRRTRVSLITVGGDVYEACSHCHQQYMDAIKNANK